MLGATGKTALALAMLTAVATAQNPPGDALTISFDDIAAIKQKAEAGDVTSQVKLAGALASRFHASEALEWYRKAANQGNVEAQYHLGSMLLFGAPGIPKELAVNSEPIEGIKWTFRAATNLHPQACLNMSRAVRCGMGTSTNLIAAYAWLRVLADTGAGSIVGRVQMNELALQLDTAALTQAQVLAAQFKAHQWQFPELKPSPGSVKTSQSNSDFFLNGITFGKRPLATVNNRTLAEGDTATIPLESTKAVVKCMKIEPDSVLILVDGETTPRKLTLQN